MNQNEAMIDESNESESIGSIASKKVKEILKIKVNNNLHNKVIREITNYFVDLFEELNERNDRSLILEQVKHILKSDKSILNFTKKLPNYVIPIEKELELEEDQPLFYHYLPLEQSIQNICNVEEVFEEMFHSSYAKSNYNLIINYT